MLFCVFVVEFSCLFPQENTAQKKIRRNDNDNGKMHKDIKESGRKLCKTISHHFSAKCFSTLFLLLEH